MKNGENRPAVILVVEDRDSTRRMLVTLLEDAGYRALEAATGSEALSLVRSKELDVVITDLDLPHCDGLTVLQAAKEAHPLCAVIVITAYGTIENAVKSVKSGAFDFLTKPFETAHLMLLIERALEQRHLVTDNLVLRTEFAGDLAAPVILGRSRALLEAKELVLRVAASDATVLLIGETGTGKELFAKVIHHNSPRSKEPFMAINCAAIPRELMENELFGSEKGAFTGADHRKLGKLELANHGTVFLDEVGDLDLSLQAKLLRVLQERRFERVGGTKTIGVDVRIVAATNKDLWQATQEGKFRDDLLYRLNVFPITLPSLSERKEDIPELAEHFLINFSQEMRKPIRSISSGAMGVFQDYHWPGNVRELENVVERAVILCDGGQVEERHVIPQPVTAGPGRQDAASAEPEAAGGKKRDGVEPLDVVSRRATELAEREMIARALDEAKGNKAEAARLLGVSYKTLWMRMKRYNLSSGPEGKMVQPTEEEPAHSNHSV